MDNTLSLLSPAVQEKTLFPPILQQGRCSQQNNYKPNYNRNDRTRRNRAKSALWSGFKILHRVRLGQPIQPIQLQQVQQNGFHQ
ncbi:MAG: hypothetical protein CM15mL6_070 [uncultured marine virus]|nr:MAG: hypothetical protein CM15mL6_070 [uncultured marine virus]